MPFDIVWLLNNRHLGKDEYERALHFKNLIGRAGRLSEEKKFDYGYVYTNDPKGFSNKLKISFQLNKQSILESPDIQDADMKELIDSINNDTFDDDKNLPLSRVERLSQEAVLESAKAFLDIIYSDPSSIKESIGGDANRDAWDLAKTYLQTIFEASLNRKLLDGERAVFSNAISIFFQMAQGRSFREIVGIRYSYIARRDEKSGIFANFSQPAEKLPNASLDHYYSLFPENTRVDQVSYDAVVFDTYDYMDQVISFSLSDTFVAAFKIYEEKIDDERAEQVIELFRYGTNNQKHILLMRYGFPPEMVGELSDYVERVDEREIVFKSSIHSAPPAIRDMTGWYLPSIAE